MNPEQALNHLLGIFGILRPLKLDIPFAQQVQMANSFTALESHFRNAIPKAPDKDAASDSASA